MCRVRVRVCRVPRACVPCAAGHLVRAKRWVLVDTGRQMSLCPKAGRMDVQGRGRAQVAWGSLAMLRVASVGVPTCWLPTATLVCNMPGRLSHETHLG